MATWSEIAAEAPGLAARARELLSARTHLTLATLRRDGSPRISGTEAMFVGDDLWVGSMPGAVKALDLRRDPRFALHSGSEDPPGWTGDAKVAGRAEEVADSARKREVAAASSGGEELADQPMHLFRLDLEEVVVVELGEPRDHLVITSWHPGRGVERLERR